MVGVGQHEGRQGELAESYILILRQQTEKDWGLAWAFGTSKAAPSNTFPPTKPHLPVLSNTSAPWGPSIQIYEPCGPFSLKPPHSVTPAYTNPTWEQGEGLLKGGRRQ